MFRFLIVGACALLLLPAAAAAQCDGITVRQDGIFVVVEHLVDYNCAVFDMTHQVELDGAVLRVTEVGIADAWADCICPYASKVVVGGMAPGDYMLVFAYADWVEGEGEPSFTWCELPFSVVGAGRENDQLMIWTVANGCGMPAVAVPDDWPALPDWSDVKGLFR